MFVFGVCIVGSFELLLDKVLVVMGGFVDGIFAGSKVWGRGQGEGNERKAGRRGLLLWLFFFPFLFVLFQWKKRRAGLWEVLSYEE